MKFNNEEYNMVGFMTNKQLVDMTKDELLEELHFLVEDVIHGEPDDDCGFDYDVACEQVELIKKLLPRYPKTISVTKTYVV